MGRGESGLVNAPTGSGKTYSLMLPILARSLNAGAQSQGIRAIWITPIRALTTEIGLATKRAIEGLGSPWRMATRTGDTPTSQREKIKRKPPEILITTPETLQLMLASKGYAETFKHLDCVVVDEWHELLGSKRGVQMELALSRLRTLRPALSVWGISATIGNLAQAAEVLLGSAHFENSRLIRANIRKEIIVESILPDEIERFPWAGHLGIHLLSKIIPILEESNSTLLFTNTRAQSEIWYQKILEVAPDLAGILAMHHGSIDRDLRNWVEDALHKGILKAVVCTSSLDLGVDFRPVDTIIQVGSPKGVSRFIQRAGRSGHRPGAPSRILFLPTHSLELIEAAALREAIAEEQIEAREPMVRCFDVLVQYLVTLAVSDGFDPKQILSEVRGTFAYASISEEEWNWVLQFITTGGHSLREYDAYHKVVVDDSGLWRVTDKGVAMRHRMSIGTIVGDSVLQVKFLRGGRLGTIEEWFITKLNPGDVFGFAGRFLELVRVNGNDVLVRKTNEKSAKIPSWQGGRMPLSAMMSVMLRRKLSEAAQFGTQEVELTTLRPLIQLQQERSHVPAEDELLIEYLQSREGFHLTIYPFEGRFVHEVLGALLAYRISLLEPLSFSIAMNDYGFELLSDKPIPIEDALDNDLFTTDHLVEDIRASINSAEMASRRFRDIAHIAGLIFRGYPGRPVKEKHLQASTGLLFRVFSEYDPENLLLKQAYEEVFNHQLEEVRLREALQRIQSSKIVLMRPDRPTPFSFPIMVDRLRERLSSEKLEDRIRRMTLQLERS